MTTIWSNEKKRVSSQSSSFYDVIGIAYNTLGITYDLSSPVTVWVLETKSA